MPSLFDKSQPRTKAKRPRVKLTFNAPIDAIDAKLQAWLGTAPRYLDIFDNTSAIGSLPLEEYREEIEKKGSPSQKKTYRFLFLYRAVVTCNFDEADRLLCGMKPRFRGDLLMALLKKLSAFNSEEYLNGNSLLTDLPMARVVDLAKTYGPKEVHNAFSEFQTNNYEQLFNTMQGRSLR